MVDVVLTTDRMTLRTLTAKDVNEEYVSWLNDPEVNRYMESRYTDHKYKDVIAYVERISNQPKHFLFGLFVSLGGRQIGNIKLDVTDFRHERGVIGLMIGDRNAWGRGYATEAIEAVTCYGFAQLGLQKISAGCYESNHGSKRAFEKAGFKVEGFLRSHVETGQGREGVWQLGMLPIEQSLMEEM